MAVAPSCTSKEAKEVGRCSGQSHLGISKSKSSWQFTFYRCAHPLLPNSQSLPHHKTGAIRGLQQRWSNFKVHSLYVRTLHWITPFITEIQTHIGKGDFAPFILLRRFAIQDLISRLHRPKAASCLVDTWPAVIGKRNHWESMDNIKQFSPKWSLWGRWVRWWCREPPAPWPPSSSWCTPARWRCCWWTRSPPRTTSRSPWSRWRRTWSSPAGSILAGRQNNWESFQQCSFTSRMESWMISTPSMM